MCSVKLLLEQYCLHLAKSTGLFNLKYDLEMMHYVMLNLFSLEKNSNTGNRNMLVVQTLSLMLSSNLLLNLEFHYTPNKSQAKQQTDLSCDAPLYYISAFVLHKSITLLS